MSLKKGRFFRENLPFLIQVQLLVEALRTRENLASSSLIIESFEKIPGPLVLKPQGLLC